MLIEDEKHILIPGHVGAAKRYSIVNSIMRRISEPGTKGYAVIDLVPGITATTKEDPVGITLP